MRLCNLQTLAAGVIGGKPLAVAALLAATILGGCVDIVRLDPPPADVAADLPVLGIANARFWPDGAPDALRDEGELLIERRRAAQLVQQDSQAEAHFLALSGGGDNGAFGAGLMQGWTESGTRPEFTIVTGISAGALIAPFAFLGPAYDEQLREVFTPEGKDDVVRFGGWFSAGFSLLFGTSAADTSPLFRKIERYADEAMLAAIAREYARGRLLLIGTTNLDLQRPVIWNIGAIAASGRPEALDVFRRILMASAAIPAAFPPVLMEIDHEGRTYQELHVDGGASVQVFFYPPALRLRELGGARAAPPRRVIHVVRNGRISIEGAPVSRGLVSVAGRSASTLLHFSGINDINRIYLTAVRDGLEFRVAYIGDGFKADRDGPFDPDFMRALYEHGRTAGRDSTAWETAPPLVTARPVATRSERAGEAEE